MVGGFVQSRQLITLLGLLIHFILIRGAEGFWSDMHRRSAGLSPRKVEQKDRKFFKFVTRPDIDAPSWELRVHDEEALSPGYWFIAPYQDLDQKIPGDAWVGPHIYDRRGQLIWSGTGMFQHWNAFDFDITSIGEQQLMTILFPHGKAGMILDHNYRIWKQVSLNRVEADMHAFRVIDEGRGALVITHDHVNTTPEEAEVVGFNGSCSAAYVGFAELNVNAPESPVFAWKAYHHIGLEEGTYNTEVVDKECAHNWDLMHANAIDKFPDGDYLLSSRHTDALYKISHLDGSIVWRLGGVKSDFEFLSPGNARFSRQHHAVVHAQNRTHTTISLFDNAVGTGPYEHPSNGEARGLLLALDTETMTAGIVAEYRHPQGHTVSSRGSFQLLPNGNAFVCWTYSSYISEHSPNGTVLMEAILPVAAHSYRAFKYPWIGKPHQPPDVVSEAISTKRNETHTMVYVSWNGATEVDRWALHTAQSNGSVDGEASVFRPREGFETAITFEGVADYVVVEGLDIRGNSLGKSEVVRTIPLEEQGLNQLYSEYAASRQGQQYHGWAGGRSVLTPFALGFACCAIIGVWIVWLSRTRAQTRRSWSGQGPRYKRLMQEHSP